MKKVLITGIDGFTGVYLEELLIKSGYEVYGFVYPKSTKKTHLLCNIAEKKSVAAILASIEPDYLVHLAGISFVAHNNFRQIYDINFFGTLNILDALLEQNNKPAKVILASSANVYGNPSIEVLDETVCPSPVNHYANSKLAMEFMARNYFDKLNILITRPFNYTGIGQSVQFLIPKIVSHYKTGRKEIELGNLDIVRDFSDVRFVVEVYRKLMECSAAGEIVHICSGRGISLMSIINKLNELAGHEITIKVNAAFIREKDVKVLIGSNKKLFSLIGDQKLVPIEDTLRWMFESV